MDSSRSAGSDGGADSDPRRLSTSRSTTNSFTDNTFWSDESYDLADLTVADGFRPTHDSLRAPTPPPTSPPRATLQIPSATNPRSHSPSPSHTSVASSSQNPPPQRESTEIAALNNGLSITPVPQAPTRPRPSSISKSHRPHESLTLRNEGHQTREFPLTPSPAGIATLTTSSTGPSHPFASYGQRTTDEPVVSSGDAGRASDYSGPRGPTHPYSLYPQGTAPMEETDDQTIPVGFNGMGATYQRQIGPDGEEAGDLIGPDGHLEELPPYSRYPEPANGRRPSADEEGGQVSSAGAQPTSGDTPPPQGAHVLATAALASGAGGIGIATRNPEYSSTDENLSVDRSSRSVDTTDTNRGDINVAARDFAEKLPGGKWRRRMRRKFLGVIPYWAICLLVVGLIIVGIVMGAVLGILLSDSNKKKPDGNESRITLAPQPTADVDFLSSLPDGLKPLPVGLFDLPSLDAAQAPRSCFNDTTQAQAWTCEMPFRYYSMEIGMNPNASEVKNYNIQLEAINGSNAVYVWGTQPPNIPDPVVLRLVNDSFEPGRGPAWWREVSYDKRVIISEGSFDAGHNDKREWTFTGGSEAGFNPTRFMSNKPGPAVGEKAWICTWPNVTMEIFIYPNQNASSPSWSPSSPTPGATPTSTSAAAAATTSQVPYDPTPAYPKVVKFLERRLTVDDDSTAAICEKVQIVNGGKGSEPVLDDSGEPIAVVVTERRSTVEELLEQQERSRHPDTDPDPEERKRAEITQVLRRETLELTDCGCLWWST